MYHKIKKHYHANKKVYLIVITCLLITIPCLSWGFFMPFYAQAPFGHWAQPYADACEETSIVMVDGYYNNQHWNEAGAKEQILKVLGIKNKYYGKSYDENAQEIVNIINNFTNWEARVVKTPKLEELLAELDNERPIILPAHARELKNKYYKTANMDYHVIVLSSYDAKTKEFITQDPGTKHGESLRYSYEIIMKAMHDFLPNDETKNAPAVAVFTSQDVTKVSASLDGDKDGLIKADELKYKTNLADADTDHDGFSDGEEVKNKYSPTTNESLIKNGDLIRGEGTKEVFLLKDNKRWKIVSEKTMRDNKWSWSQVKNVSEKFLNEFKYGGEIK